jgi:hypothetical protein
MGIIKLAASYELRGIPARLAACSSKLTKVFLKFLTKKRYGIVSGVFSPGK